MPGYLGSPAYLTKEIALWAAPLADEAFTATGALIDRVRDDRAATLELLTETLQIGQAGLVSEEANLRLRPNGAQSLGYCRARNYPNWQ